MINVEKLAYLSQCVEMHKAIQSGKYRHDPKVYSGHGSAFQFRSLGTVTLPETGEIIYIGEKRAIEGRSNTTRVRVLQDLIVSSLIADRCPELTSQLPKFVGWHIDEDRRPAVITEDMTKGGAVAVDAIKTTRSTLASFKRGFAYAGNFEDVFDMDATRYNMSYEADGEEKMLDMTPGPFFLAPDAIYTPYLGIHSYCVNLALDLEYTF